MKCDNKLRFSLLHQQPLCAYAYFQEIQEEWKDKAFIF
jgi:hypothetical protein